MLRMNRPLPETSHIFSARWSLVIFPMSSGNKPFVKHLSYAYARLLKLGMKDLVLPFDLKNKEKSIVKVKKYNILDMGISMPQHRG